jgi:hypothetical protein
MGDSFFKRNSFDSDQVQPDNGFDPLPDGTYPCMVETVEEKETKPGAGGKPGLQLVVKFKVVGDKFAGRVIFHRINLENANAQAVTIGRGQLSALCKACGIRTPKGPHEFCNKTLRVGVKVVPDNRTPGALQNKVMKVEPMTTAAPAASVPQGEPVTAGASPWAAN